jgi:hypothetical protein
MRAKINIFPFRFVILGYLNKKSLNKLSKNLKKGYLYQKVIKHSMIIKFFTLLCFMLIFAVSLSGQSYDQLKIQNMFEGYYGNKARNSKINNERLGSEYLIDDWHEVTLQLKDGEVKFDQGRINIHDGTVEIIYKGEEKFVSSRFMDHVELFYLGKKRRMIPADNYTENGKKLRGFLEVAKENTPAVFVYHHTYLRKPNPHANIAGGYTVDRLMKVSENYLFNGATLYKVKSKKDIKKLYPEQKAKIDEFIRMKSLDMDQAEDIASLLKLLQI